MKQLNLSFIIEELGGDRDVMIELLLTLKEMISEYCSNVEKAFEMIDYNDIRKEAHKMMNPCSMFGLKEISDLMIHIEELAKNAMNVNEIIEGHNKAKKLMDELNREIEDMLS